METLKALEEIFRPILNFQTLVASTVTGIIFTAFALAMAAREQQSQPHAQTYLRWCRRAAIITLFAFTVLWFASGAFKVVPLYYSAGILLFVPSVIIGKFAFRYCPRIVQWVTCIACLVSAFYVVGLLLPIHGQHEHGLPVPMQYCIAFGSFFYVLASIFLQQEFAPRQSLIAGKTPELLKASP